VVKRRDKGLGICVDLVSVELIKVSQNAILLSIGALVFFGAVVLYPRRSSASVTDKKDDTLQAATLHEIEVTAQRIASVTNSHAASEPRGIRNNNPGNLEYNPEIQWKGQIGSDGRYAVFRTAREGIRAMMIDLHTGFVRDGENTIREIIAEWAPPIENATNAYMSSVMRQTGYGIDEPLIWSSAVIPLAKAITLHENGKNPYPDAVFQAAYLDTGKI
jgi:Na+-transporting NADH:ubiquinone oxidoreductase subunit NqrC